MEENKNELVEVDSEGNKLTFQEKNDILVDQIINEDNVERTKEMINLFNVNMAKKNVARVHKLNSLLDKVNDQAIDRFTRRPEDVSNKELLDYMSVVQTQIEKSSNMVKSISEAQPIQFNQQNNVTVNVNNDGKSLNRESRERILNAIKSIVKEAQEDNAEIIDVEPVDKKV